MKIKAKIQGKEVELMSVIYMMDGKKFATIAKDIESITIQPDDNATGQQL